MTKTKFFCLQPLSQLWLLFLSIGTFDRVPNPHLTSTKAPKYFNRSKGTAPPRAMTRSLSDRLRLMWQATWYIAAKTAIVVCVCVSFWDSTNRLVWVCEKRTNLHTSMQLKRDQLSNGLYT